MENYNSDYGIHIGYKKNEIKQHLIDSLNDFNIEDIKNYIDQDNKSDLHHEIFNTDYYIIGTHKAKVWCSDEVFNIINYIKDYEMLNFGSVTTNISNPERVVNMYVYIIGELLINDSEEFDFASYIKTRESKINNN